MKSGFSVIIIFLALSLAGLALLPLLPVKLMPSEQLPVISVSYGCSGMSSRVVEIEVTSRLEGALNRISGIRRIESKSANGWGNITLHFEKNSDLDSKRLEVSTIIRQRYKSFPKGTSYPSIRINDVNRDNTAPFMTYAVAFDGKPGQLSKILDSTVIPSITSFDGIEKVDINGLDKTEIVITYDAVKLKNAGYTPADISEALIHDTGRIHLGASVNHDDGTVTMVATAERADDLDRLSHLAVTNAKGKETELSQLAALRIERERPNSIFRIDGKNAVYLNVTPSKSANQITLSKMVRKAVETVVSPSGNALDLIVIYDATDRINMELNKVYFRSGLTLLLLLVFLVVVSRNLRYTLLVAISLAINLAVAVLLYYFCQIEIQLYSLAGITVSLNLIIDNTIVMCDHYKRHLRKDVFPAILAATLTTVASLCVVFFLDDEIRLNLIDFVIVLIVNLAVSLAVALFLVPALAHRLGIVSEIAKPTGKRTMRIYLWLNKIYATYLRFALRFRIPVLIFAFALCGVTGWWFFDRVKEGEYFSHPDFEPSIFITSQLPAGSTIEQMDARMRQLENKLMPYNGISYFKTEITSGRRGSITVYFKPEYANSGYPYAVKNDIVGKVLTIGAGSWSVGGLKDNGFNNAIFESAGDNVIKLTGFDYDRLVEYALRLKDSLSTNRRVQNIDLKAESSYWKEDRTEWVLLPDMTKLKNLDISIYDFKQAVANLMMRDNVLGVLSTNDGALPIRLKSSQSDTYDIWSFMNLPLECNGKTVKLRDVATLTTHELSPEIIRKNQNYQICVQYQYTGSQKGAESLLSKRIEDCAAWLPTGYAAESEELSGRRYTPDYTRYWLLALVAALTFLISCILFNSFIWPFAILAIIPLSYTGIFLTFLIFNLKMDEGGFSSFILTGALSVNAAIYIIQQFGLIKSRDSLRRYLMAFRYKIGPIITTVVSTVIGFVPFVIGTERESFWFGLAAGTMGGMIWSLLAIVLFLPLFFVKRKKKAASV